MRVKFEFDQPYNQTGSKIVTGKISNNRIKPVWLGECSDKQFSVNKRNGGGLHGTHPLQIQQMELPED